MRKNCGFAHIETTTAMYERAAILFESPSVVMVSFIGRNIAKRDSKPTEKVDTIHKGEIISMRRYLS